jgi:hypothetical protein
VQSSRGSDSQLKNIRHSVNWLCLGLVGFYQALNFIISEVYIWGFFVWIFAHALLTISILHSSRMPYYCECDTTTVTLNSDTVIHLFIYDYMNLWRYFISKHLVVKSDSREMTRTVNRLIMESLMYSSACVNVLYHIYILFLFLHQQYGVIQRPFTWQFTFWLPTRST